MYKLLPDPRALTTPGNIAQDTPQFLLCRGDPLSQGFVIKLLYRILIWVFNNLNVIDILLYQMARHKAKLHTLVIPPCILGLLLEDKIVTEIKI